MLARWTILAALFVMPTAAADEHLREMERVIDGLRAGHDALRHLGMEDEARRMEEILHEVRREFEAHQRELERGHRERDRGERHRDDDRHRDDERHEERRHREMRHDLEVARVAMHGLVEVGKEELAHRLEHAIHAQELRLEGRDDREARRVMAEAPSDGHVVEVLQVAARLWREFGHDDRARRVHELAEKIAKNAREGREGHDRRAPDDVQERIDRLERHVDELGEAMRDVHRALERMQRPRRPEPRGRIRVY